MTALHREQVAFEVRAVQRSLAQMAADRLRPDSMDSLACLTRLAVEFFYIVVENDAPLSRSEAQYMGGSVLAGVDSFVDLCSAYDAAGGPDVAIALAEVSLDSLRSDFRELFAEFRKKTDALERVRLVLDMFRFQLGFVALTYMYASV